MISYRQTGTVLTDHVFTVPLDHDRPDAGQIEVFAREVVAAGRDPADLPWLLFLQGGPGFGAPRPAGRDSWLGRALEDYRVLLLDQRGTGRSSPASRQTLARFPGAREQARYLGCFRADSIVRDAELIRRQLTGGAPWSVLGQSFGGFCAVSYLSFFPEGLREVFITGGLPGLDTTADDVYRATYPRVAAKTMAHYDRYPQDAQRAALIARAIPEEGIPLPGGGTLTAEAFQALGQLLGSGTGSEALHYLLEDPFAAGELSDAFRHEAQSRLSFVTAPMYAVLHESCYAQGKATRWAAQRMRAEFGEFDPAVAVSGDGPLLFTGEMIYPWMFRTDPALVPLRDAAQELAERDDWPLLYDSSRLLGNDVPAAAVIYFGDMYVPPDFSLATAAGIRGLRTWVTSEYEHDGLRVSNGAVLDRLIAMASGRA
jgi:pimeloyl-ACP methyl ester carboxylesterase